MNGFCRRVAFAITLSIPLLAVCAIVLFVKLPDWAPDFVLHRVPIFDMKVRACANENVQDIFAVHKLIDFSGGKAGLEASIDSSRRFLPYLDLARPTGAVAVYALLIHDAVDPAVIDAAKSEYAVHPRHELLTLFLWHEGDEDDKRFVLKTGHRFALSANSRHFAEDTGLLVEGLDVPSLLAIKQDDRFVGESEPAKCLALLTRLPEPAAVPIARRLLAAEHPKVRKLAQQVVDLNAAVHE